MKFFLVLYYAAGISSGTSAVSIGPYDDIQSCIVASQLAREDNWQSYCYPIGKVERK